MRFARRYFRSVAWARASCRRPRPCPRKCCRSSTSPSSNMRSRRPQAAGIEEFIFVTGRSKTAIEDHFDHSYELETTLRERGKMRRFTRSTSWMPASRPDRLYAPAGAAGPRPCGVVRAQSRRRRALRGAARRRSHPRRHALPHADDGGLSRGRGQLRRGEDVPREHTNRYGILDVEPTMTAAS